MRDDDLSGVDKPDDVLQLLELDILEDDDGMLVEAVHGAENSLEPSGAGGEDLLVTFDAASLRAQRHVAEDLVIEVAPKGGINLVIVVGPGQDQIFS